MTNRAHNNIDILERMAKAVEKVRERLLRAAGALEKEGLDYAVIGGNAVAAWVSTVDESAVRNTRDVDLLINRKDFEKIKEVLEKEGFIYKHITGVDLFLEEKGSKARDSIHLVYAGEKVMPEYIAPAPDVSESEYLSPLMRVISLEALVRMKLTSFRLQDQVHLMDLNDAGLINANLVSNLPPPFAKKLKALIAGGGQSTS